MNGRGRGLLLIGFTGFLVFGFNFACHFGRAVWGNPEIWWTPAPLAFSLDESGKIFELSLRDTLLQKHLETGSLYVSSPQGELQPVTFDDIKVRINNWHEIRASFLLMAVFSAFMLGVSTICIILGAAEFFSRKEPKGKIPFQPERGHG